MAVVAVAAVETAFAGATVVEVVLVAAVAVAVAATVAAVLEAVPAAVAVSGLPLLCIILVHV